MNQSRLQINLQILDQLGKYLRKYPDQRFGQALRNIGIVDSISAVPHEGPEAHLKSVRIVFSNEFYTESHETLRKVWERLNESEKLK